MGNIITDHGMQAGMAPPQNKAGVQRSIANHLSPYCPTIRPLTQLTQTEVPFLWGQVRPQNKHQEQYARLQIPTTPTRNPDSLSTEPDPKKNTLHNPPGPDQHDPC